jgi:chromosome segregation ATPase
VWCKNQLYTTGTEIKSLERELTDLKDRNEAVLTKIAQLSSTAKLRERYDNGFIKLVPITNDHITMLNNTAPPTRTGDLRPAANERTHE